MLKILLGLYIISVIISGSYIAGWLIGTIKRFSRENPKVDKKLIKASNPKGSWSRLILILALPIANISFCWFIDKYNEELYKKIEEEILRYYEHILEERLWV